MGKQLTEVWPSPEYNEMSSYSDIGLCPHVLSGCLRVSGWDTALRDTGSKFWDI